ncbi:uncharacterized protein LOC117114688, partial [Anneissia japonica]|uniref:uncharacterized protein LOC117114688 n=1 Tax=Anneissia japonica TaxID=1529436 RepID=UPI0014258CD9
MLVHVFGAKSYPGCANYSLKDVAKRLSDKYGQDASEFVQNNFYVDDGLQSVETADEAIDLIQRTVAMLKEGGFKLHKFLSNSKQVLKALPDDCIASNVSQKDLSNLPTERTLGILWDPTLDVFTFEGNMKENPPTRRGILSTVSAVFDPLGLIGPYILQGKRILQNVWAEGKDWDEPLNDDTIQHWIAWKEQLQYLSNIKISRCYKAPNATGKVSSVELHHFSDASTSGYGQCSYLRLVHEDGTVIVSLVMSKCRVTPLKTMTIPRLELTAAMVSARIARILREELKYPNLVEHFWSDSKVALGYISNDSRRFHVFVANRVQTIRNLSEPTQWHYIASEQNPADIASRGSSVEEFLDCDLWWQGPKFL